MAYGMNQLRKAGMAIKSMDDNYANAIKDRIVDKNDPHNKGRALAALLAGAPIEKGSIQADTLGERVLGEAMDLGVSASNLGVRYGLPAAGITAVGLGIANLGNSMRQAFAPTPEEAMDYAAQFEEAGMPEYAAQMRAAAGVQTSGTLMP